MVLGALISLVYSIVETHSAPPQTELMTQIIAVFGGIGLLLSRDVDKSTEETNGHPENEDAGERTGK